MQSNVSKDATSDLYHAFKGLDFLKTINSIQPFIYVINCTCAYPAQMSNVCCGVHSTDNSSYNELCKAMVIISRVACWLETSDVAYKCHQVA